MDTIKKFRAIHSKSTLEVTGAHYDPIHEKFNIELTCTESPKKHLIGTISRYDSETLKGFMKDGYMEPIED